MSMYGHELPPQAEAEGPDELMEGMLCARHYALRNLRDAGTQLSSLKQYAIWAERHDIEQGAVDAITCLKDLINYIEQNISEA
jgi:hypothetical protein